MRERLDDHSRFLEEQLATLEALVKEKGEIGVVVPAMDQEEHLRSMRSNPPPSHITSAPTAATSASIVVPPQPSKTVVAVASASSAIPSKVPAAVPPPPFESFTKPDVEEPTSATSGVLGSAVALAEVSKS